MTTPRTPYGQLTGAILAELGRAPATALELADRVAADESCVRVTLARLRKRGEVSVHECQRDALRRRPTLRYRLVTQ